MEYFFDSSAIIEIIDQKEAYLKFQDEVLVTNTLNLAEVYNHYLRKHNEQTADYWVSNLPFEFLEITKEIAIKGAKFRHKHEKENISYADSIGYETALANNLLFVTSDERFKEKENADYVS